MKKLALVKLVFGIILLILSVLWLIQELNKGVFPILDKSILSFLIGLFIFLSTFFDRKKNN